MESPLFPQGPQFPASVPDGFAIVPIHLFLMMANHMPMLPAHFTLAPAPRPQGRDGIYERAMACSPN